jgi:4-amino-4-deoxy-L-arabinose transferase-like glycosyltransferase
MTSRPLDVSPNSSSPPTPAPGSEETGTRGPLWFLVAVLLLVAAVRWQWMAMPFERDEGEYAVMGRLILQGELPYVAAYNMKLPGVYYSYAAIFAVLGETDVDVRFALLLLTTLSACGLAWVGWTWISPWAGAVTGALFALATMSNGLRGYAANTEHFVVFWTVLALVLGTVAARRTGRSGAGIESFLWPLLMGLCLGMAVLMKQHAVVFCAAGLAWSTTGLGLGTEGGQRRNRLVDAGLAVVGMAVGIALPWLATWGYFVWRGAGEPFWFWTVQYASAYVSETSLSTGFWRLAYTLTEISADLAPMVLLAVFGLVQLFASPGRWLTRFAWLGLAGASCLVTCPGWLFRDHYFLMAVPGVALLAGNGVATLGRLLSGRIRPGQADSPTAATLSGSAGGPTPGLLTGIVAVVSCLAAAIPTVPYWSLGPMELSRVAYGFNPFPESITLAQELRRRTTADEAIAVIGSEPQIYFYSARRAATAYLYTYPLVEKQPFAGRMNQEFIRDLESKQPAYIVLVLSPSSWLGRVGADFSLLKWAAEEMPQRYTLVGATDVPAVGVATEWGWDHPELAKLSQINLPLQVWKRKP